MGYLKKGEKRHHSKGKSIKVEPFTRNDVERLKKYLFDKPRDLCLLTLGINTNLRSSDLCRITIGMVKDKKIGDEIVLKEIKTKKARRITINGSVSFAINQLLESKSSK